MLDFPEVGESVMILVFENPHKIRNCIECLRSLSRTSDDCLDKTTV